MTAPTYFQLSGELYADFGDGRLAVYRTMAVPHGFVSKWVAIPAPDVATLWPSPTPSADCPACDAIGPCPSCAEKAR